MPRGFQHKVVLVGVEDGLQAALQPALRLRGAQVAAVCPDVVAARTEALAHPSDAHLFIVSLGPEADPAHLTMLTGVLPGQPVLVFLAPGDGLTRMIAAQRAGAAQVVPLPWQPDDFLRALDCMSAQFAPADRASRIIAVCGVSGGCGATTLALNLACELGLPSGVRGQGSGVRGSGGRARVFSDS